MTRNGSRHHRKKNSVSKLRSVLLFALVRDVLEAAACYLRNVCRSDTRTVFVKTEHTFH